jgi:hypothetical protein
MPTVLTVNGYAVKVYYPPREHGPAHVHVFRAGEEVLIDLDPVAVRENRGMRTSHVVEAVGIVEDHLEVLRSEWERIHD